MFAFSGSALCLPPSALNKDDARALRARASEPQSLSRVPRYGIMIVWPAL